jgi:hypothetical protein
MAPIALAWVLAALLVACGDEGQPLPAPRPTIVVPSPPPPAPPPQVFAPVRIGLGDTEGRFTGTELLYEFVSPSRGTLVAKLDWVLTSAFLVLVIDSHSLFHNYPPLQGRVVVEPQQMVTLAVRGGGNDEGWFDEKFVLTLTLE